MIFYIVSSLVLKNRSITFNWRRGNHASRLTVKLENSTNQNWLNCAKQKTRYSKLLQTRENYYPTWLCSSTCSPDFVPSDNHMFRLAAHGLSEQNPSSEPIVCCQKDEKKNWVAMIKILKHIVVLFHYKCLFFYIQPRRFIMYYVRHHF